MLFGLFYLLVATVVSAGLRMPARSDWWDLAVPALSIAYLSVCLALLRPTLGRRWPEPWPV